MIWRTDKPTEKVIVAKLTEDFCHQKDSYAILRHVNEPYHHYSEDGEEIPYTAIEEWASLEEDKLSEGLEEAARHYSEHTRFHWPNQVKPAYDTFIAGAEWMKKRDDLETADLLAIAHLQGMEQQKAKMMEEAVEFECIGKKVKMTIQELINYYIDQECCDVADECGF